MLEVQTVLQHSVPQEMLTQLRIRIPWNLENFFKGNTTRTFSKTFSLIFFLEID